MLPMPLLRSLTPHHMLLRVVVPAQNPRYTLILNTGAKAMETHPNSCRRLEKQLPSILCQVQWGCAHTKSADELLWLYLDCLQDVEDVEEDIVDWRFYQCSVTKFPWTPVKPPIDYIFFFNGRQSGYSHNSSSADLVRAQPHCTWQRMGQSRALSWFSELNSVFPPHTTKLNDVSEMCNSSFSAPEASLTAQERTVVLESGVPCHGPLEGSTFS